MTNVTRHHVFHHERIAFANEGPMQSDRCGILWLGGFKSQMTGEKASRLAQWAQANSRNQVRFDYSGHGQSSGEFTEGTITSWLDQSVEMFRQHAKGPRILVGSSMGGWIALLAAQKLAANFPEDAKRIRGLVLLAPAVDMTATLIPQGLTAQERARLARDGIAERPSAYGDGPYQITRRLLADGDRHLLFGKPFVVDYPVRILHGDQDPDVPWKHGHRVFEMLEGQDITFTLIKGGDHRLSDAGSLDLLENAVSGLCAGGDGSAGLVEQGL
jgi:pimeloyl-ACP methyl ester carboxylesterase